MAASMNQGAGGLNLSDGISESALFEQIYREDGIYDSLQAVAFNLGEVSVGGRMAQMTETLPGFPRETVTVAAKRAGGLVVARDFVSSSGYSMSQEYRLLLSSGPSIPRCELVTHARGSKYIRTILRPQFLRPQISAGLPEFTAGLNQALIDVSLVTDDPRLNNLQIVQPTPASNN